MKRMTLKTLTTLALCAGLGLLPTPLPEVLPFTSTPDLISNVAYAQYGTSRRVARRTSRRTSRRHNYYDNVGAVSVGVGVGYGAGYVTALPTGCTTVIKSGVTYHQCGSTMYAPAYQGDQVVYVAQ